MPFSFLNSATIQSITRWSMLSPPRCVSPLVDLTSTTPSPTSSTEMSNVPPPKSYRSEEHTSELQSLRHLVCRLLLEKKKKKKTNEQNSTVNIRTAQWRQLEDV